MKSIRKIISAAQRGALDAQIKYSLWSGGLGVVNSGVEAFVSTKIAEAIYEDLHRSENLLVGLEYPVQSIIAEINIKVRGRKGGRLNNNGRVDVVVWDSNSVPRIIIEVKRQLRWQALNEDALRIMQFIKKFGSQHEGGAIEAGIIVVPYITWRNSDDTEIFPRQDSLDKIREEAKSLGFTMEKIISEPLGDDDKFRYPGEIFDDEYHGRENLTYNCACFTLRSKNFKS